MAVAPADLEIATILLDFGLALMRKSEIAIPLKKMLCALSCEYIRIVRYPRDGNPSPQTIAGVASDQVRWLRVPNQFELNNPVMQVARMAPDGGTVRTMEALRFDDRPEVDSPWNRLSIRYGFEDVWTLVLESGPSYVDVAEVFSRMPLERRGNACAKTVGLIAKGMAEVWGRRPGGFVEWALAAADSSRVAKLPLLSHENPLGLTKSEFRVCDRFIKGHSIKRIEKALDISPHTVRSHLRSVYSKTGTNSQCELLLLLLNSRPAEVDEARTGTAS